MLDFFWNFITFIFALGALITVHEFGHFLMARYYGVKVERFSIGFGKILWKWYDKHNTEYVISIIPFGGYVKMLDTKTKLIKPHELYDDAFNHKTVWQRGIIICAGPIFNIIFSILLYCLVFMCGISNYRPIIEQIIPNSIASNWGIVPGMEIKYINNIATPDWNAVKLQLIHQIKQQEINIGISSNNSKYIKNYSCYLSDIIPNFDVTNPIIGLGIVPISSKIELVLKKIHNNSLAMKAGLKIGDKIIAINNQIVTDWQSFTQKIRDCSDKILTISIERQGVALDFKIKPESKLCNNDKITNYLGISPNVVPLPKEYQVIHSMGFFTACNKAIIKTAQMIYLMINILGKLIIGDIGLSNLSGPISIAQGAGISAEYGFIYYLMFLSMISINLSVINLLPLPSLDGGHLLFLIIEKIKGKAISEKIQEICYRFGFILLLLLMCLAFFNDLSRLKS